jgi:hypothetical protein
MFFINKFLRNEDYFFNNGLNGLNGLIVILKLIPSELKSV